MSYGFLCKAERNKREHDYAFFSYARWAYIEKIMLKHWHVEIEIDHFHASSEDMRKALHEIKKSRQRKYWLLFRLNYINKNEVPVRHIKKFLPILKNFINNALRRGVPIGSIIELHILAKICETCIKQKSPLLIYR